MTKNVDIPIAYDALIRHCDAWIRHFPDPTRDPTVFRNQSGRSPNIAQVPVDRQTELVLDQRKLCLAAAGASLGDVMKCNIYCTSPRHFAAVNAVYARHFSDSPPAHLRVHPGMDRTVRHRDRLRRDGVTRVARGPRHMDTIISVDMTIASIDILEKIFRKSRKANGRHSFSWT